jgi:ribosome-associated protein
VESITIRDEFIKLGQAMKLASMVSSGVDAKMVITEGQVKVNGEVCLQRGKKLYSGDVIEYNNQKVSIN